MSKNQAKTLKNMYENGPKKWGKSSKFGKSSIIMSKTCEKLIRNHEKNTEKLVKIVKIHRKLHEKLIKIGKKLEKLTKNLNKIVRSYWKWSDNLIKMGKKSRKLKSWKNLINENQPKLWKKCLKHRKLSLNFIKIIRIGEKSENCLKITINWQKMDENWPITLKKIIKI